MCFLADTCMAVAKLPENKTFLMKCESAFLVNKFRNITFLSISILQGSYSSALKAGLLIFLKLAVLMQTQRKRNVGVLMEPILMKTSQSHSSLTSLLSAQKVLWC